MSRDDSVLYSGVTSSSMLSPVQLQVDKKRQEQSEQRAKTRLELAPYAVIVNQEIQKEIDSVRVIDYGKFNESMSEADFKNELLLNKRLLERLTSIQKRLDNILREH